MKIGIIKETSDNRVAIVPELAKKLQDEGNELIAEKGCGETALFTNEAYEAVGVKLTSRKEVLETADILPTIFPLEKADLKQLKKDAILISSYQPYFSSVKLEEAAGHQLTVFSMDMIPRITLAQAMDVLSSMASIAGYKAVIMAANHLPTELPQQPYDLGWRDLCLLLA